MQVVDYATEGRLQNLEFSLDARRQPDVACFDFTELSSADHSTRFVQYASHPLILALVGDYLHEVGRLAKLRLHNKPFFSHFGRPAVASRAAFCRCSIWLGWCAASLKSRLQSCSASARASTCFCRRQIQTISQPHIIEYVAFLDFLLAKNIRIAVFD